MKLPLHTTASDCWNIIGVRGDRSCPELPGVVHCQNCPVFAAAGRHFLDAPSPPGYLEEWTERLAAPVEEAVADLESVLTFRLADEWLALPVRVLIEVTTLRPVHRVPYRGGLLAGLVNIRGELHLCAHLARLLGIESRTAPGANATGLADGTGSRVAEPSNDGDRTRRLSDRDGRGVRRITANAAGERGSAGASLSRSADEEAKPATGERLLVVQRDADRWVFPVDAVGQVFRVPRVEIGSPPATVGRAAAHLSRGVFPWEGRLVGLLDDARLFEALRARLR